jgi:hypothetical protein
VDEKKKMVRQKWANVIEEGLGRRLNREGKKERNREKGIRNINNFHIGSHVNFP